MSSRRGGAYLKTNKSSKALSIIIPCAVLLLLVAAFVYFYMRPQLIQAALAKDSPRPDDVLQEAANNADEFLPNDPVRLEQDVPEPTPTDPKDNQVIGGEEPSGNDSDTTPGPEPGGSLPPEQSENPTPSNQQPNESPESDPPETAIIKPNGDIFSACAVLINLDSGETVYKNNETTSNYPASLTKILSAVVVLESGIDMDTPVTFTEEMLSGLLEADASVAGFAAGDEVSLTDLLYGLMLPSGADCANALALRVAGSIEGFVELMNDKASSLGMNDSHFKNPTGLHSPEQYTTAADLALLLEHAMKNDLFFTIFTKPTYTTSQTASHPDGINLFNYVLTGNFDITFPGGKILGAKTGFTTPAGQCLASYTTINDTGYILVTMGAGREYKFDNHYSLKDALYLYGRISSGDLSG